MTDFDTTYDFVANCIEGRCNHSTTEQCVAAWRPLMGHADGQVRDADLPSPATLARARAKALTDFADAHRFPNEWVLYRREDDSPVLVGELLRETARQERVKAEG